METHEKLQDQQFLSPAPYIATLSFPCNKKNPKTQQENPPRNSEHICMQDFDFSDNVYIVYASFFLDTSHVLLHIDLNTVI